MRRTVAQLLKSPIVNKKIKKFKILNGSKEEILSRREVIKKYGAFEELSYTEYLDKSNFAEIRVEYDCENIEYWSIHSLIEALQTLEKQYGGGCKIVSNKDIYADTPISISYNKTLSNELHLFMEIK